MARVSRTVRAAVLLGDWNRYGVVLGAVMLVVVNLFMLPNVQWLSPSYDRVTTGTTTAERASTNFREGGLWRPRESIYAYDATYTVAGTSYSVRSYSTAELTSGTSVEIEYDASAPASARIRDMRTKPLLPWSPTALFLFAVSISYGVIALRWLRSARRALQLLEVGRVGTARILGIDRSRMGVGRPRGYRRDMVDCEIALPDGGTVRTRVAAYGPIGEKGDEATVIYDPAAPENATIVSTLPGMIAVTADGRVMSLYSTGRIWGMVALGIAVACTQVGLLIAFF